MLLSTFKKNILLVSLGLLMLNGCSHLGKEDCASKDWYEVGRQDGSLGKFENEYAGHKKSCDLKDPAFSQSLYKNGRNAGLVSYCSNSNAFLLGKDLKAIPKVCPSVSRQSFLKHYNLGKRVHGLEKQKRKLDKKIIKLSEGSQRDPSSSKSRSQLRKLQSKRNDISKKIEKFSEDSFN